MNDDVPDVLRTAWPAFLAKVERRLEKGAVEYGDASLRAPPAELAREIEEELLDVVGWGFLLWVRMRGIAARVGVPEVRTGHAWAPDGAAHVCLRCNAYSLSPDAPPNDICHGGSK